MGMVRLKAVLLGDGRNGGQGTGEELDQLGALLSLPRSHRLLPGSVFGSEPDDLYRARLCKHPLVRLLIEYD